MLVLTRSVGESIIIGDDVKVMLLGTDRGHVRIGIEAPRELSVHREEVYKRIKKEEEDKDNETN